MIEFTTISTIGVRKGDNYYPLICDMNYCHLFDCENNSNQQIKYSQLMQINEDDYINAPYTLFSLLNTNNENQIIFTYLLNNRLPDHTHQIHLSKINLLTNTNDFSEFEAKNRANNIINDAEQTYNLKCFMTSNKYIECVYIKYDTNCAYYVAIYDESLNLLDNIFLQNIIYYYPFYIPINAIHLKNEIDAYYIDYTNQISSPLYIQINELINTGSTFSFNNKIPERSVVFDDFNSFSISNKRILQEDMIKITDNIFAHSILHPNNIIIFTLFDLYNNDQNLFIRYYKIDFTLYNIPIVNQFNLFNFNSFLGLVFHGELGNDLYSFSIIFGNSKKNIDKMSLDIYKSTQGFLLDLQRHYSKIDNNLFGYELIIKISSISNGLEGIKFFSINENSELNINDPIDKDDTILFDFSAVNAQIGQIYTIEITSTIKSPEYADFIQLYDKYEPIPTDSDYLDYSTFYERRIVEEKIFAIELKFGCSESSTACNYPNLSTKTIEIGSYNMMFLSNYIYSEEQNSLLSAYLYYRNDACSNDPINIEKYNYMNDCLDECPQYYNPDSSNNCKFMCENENQYIFYSHCYGNCPENSVSYISETNKKICKCKNLYYSDQSNNVKCLSSLICDDNYPVLDMSTNECHNYRVKYEGKYYYECPQNTCISESSTSSNKICEERTSDMKIFNGICFNNFNSILSNLETMARNNIKINDREGITLSVYSFGDYNKNFDKLLQNNIGTTMIDLRECLSQYKKSNNIETDIYIIIADTPKIYSNETINRFDFELYSENLEKINNLDICKDTKMKVYSPITNPKIINLELGQYFYEQGEYNIFNKEDKFYKDICSGADMDDNDITLNDRYIDIYPHEIQICPNNCECLGINYTTNILMCDCEIKVNNDDNTNEYEYELMDKEDILNYFKDFNNLAEYFGDMFNFKIAKCFNLLYDINNYTYNTGFYIGVTFFVSSLSLLIVFKIIGFYSIRKIFYNNLGNIIKGKNNKNKILTKCEDENTKPKKAKEETKMADFKHMRKNKKKKNHHSKKGEMIFLMRKNIKKIQIKENQLVNMSLL